MEDNTSVEAFCDAIGAKVTGVRLGSATQESGVVIGIQSEKGQSPMSGFGCGICFRVPTSSDIFCSNTLIYRVDGGVIFHSFSPSCKFNQRFWTSYSNSAGPDRCTCGCGRGRCFRFC